MILIEISARPMIGFFRYRSTKNLPMRQIVVLLKSMMRYTERSGMPVGGMKALCFIVPSEERISSANKNLVTDSLF